MSTMNSWANGFVGFVAAVHFLFAYLEFSGRNSRQFYDKFKIQLHSDQAPEQIGRIVANAALFNALLGIGLVASFGVPGSVNWLQVYLLTSIIVAGIAGSTTLQWWVGVAQSGPATVALVLVLLASRANQSPAHS